MGRGILPVKRQNRIVIGGMVVVIVLLFAGNTDRLPVLRARYSQAPQGKQNPNWRFDT